MSGSARKRVSKWDTKEEDTQHLSGDDYIEKSGSYFREKDPRFYPEGNGRNGSRRSGQDDEDEHLKSRQQHSGEAWLTRSRVSHEDDNDAMMGYYDPRKSTEQDESRQQYFRQSPSRDRSRTRRSGSRSNSRSRSRSPLKRVRRDEGGSFDRHKTRARVSPRPGREFDGSRYNRADDYDWDAKNRKTRDTKYYTEDSREQQHPGRVSGRSDYSSDFQEDNHNPRRREFPEGEFNRTANVPCRFFASGYCRNGNNCKFSHHGGGASARGSPERKPQEEMFSRQESYNHNGTTERMRNSHRWNDIERSDAGKSSKVVEVSRGVGKGMAETKGNNGSWIDDMEMSPDWNYGVKTSKNPANEERGVLKDTLAPSYEHGSGNQRSVSMFPTVGEKTVAASSHHNFSNNLVNTAPPVQGFNQNMENHSAVPYQSTPIAIGGSQVPLSTVTNLPSSHHSCSNNLINTAPPVQPFNQNMENHSAVPVPYQSTPLAVGGSQVPLNLPGGLSSSNPENGNAQNTVSMEELNRISNISASLKQLFGNGQPIPLLQSTLNPKQTMQVPPEVYVQKEQPLHTQSDLPIDTGGVPAVTTALQINNRDAQEVKIPETLVSLAGNPKAASTEGKKTDKEGIKTDKEEEETAEDAENVVEEEEEEENNKKEKDPKGMRAFKFALVEIVKELLKPAWKVGGMNKDAYKNIVKKVVDKVTGAIQSGNIPQTQEKIDHYLSASKPKLTKLVQAYVSKVKKS